MGRIAAIDAAKTANLAARLEFRGYPLVALLFSIFEQILRFTDVANWISRNRLSSSQRLFWRVRIPKQIQKQIQKARVDHRNFTVN
ncbi:MAG: hypothetical protein WC073_15790 [Sterolibacterium sp.]